MANTFTQLYIQFIFAVKFRAACIHASWKESLHKYITGIFQENKHKMLQIDSMPDQFIRERDHFCFDVSSKMSSTLLIALTGASSRFAKITIPIFLSGINVRMLL